MGTEQGSSGLVADGHHGRMLDPPLYGDGIEAFVDVRDLAQAEDVVLLFDLPGDHGRSGEEACALAGRRR